jgi:hypothetical protein
MNEKDTKELFKKGFDLINRRGTDKTDEDKLQTFKMQKELHYALMNVFKNDITNETDIENLRDHAMHLYAYMDSAFGQIFTAIEMNDKAKASEKC